MSNEKERPQGICQEAAIQIRGFINSFLGRGERLDSRSVDAIREYVKDDRTYHSKVDPDCEAGGGPAVGKSQE